MPDPSMNPVTITAYFDADHSSDQFTRLSITISLVCVNSTPIKWYCNRHNTGDSSTYVYELVDARLTTELFMENRYKLRILGVPIHVPYLMLGDNICL